MKSFCSVSCNNLINILQEREVDVLVKDFEVAKESQAEFLGDRCGIYFLKCLQNNI